MNLIALAKDSQPDDVPKSYDDLLKPIAADKPCGEDFTYHPSFQNLEMISRGKPETQSFGSSTEPSPAEEPDWKQVRDAAVEVLGQSKQ